VLVEAFGLPQLAAGEIRRTFRDVPPTSWFAPYVYGATSVGVVEGYGDDSFQPGGSLEAWEPSYGWWRLGTTDAAGLEAAQSAANQGQVVVICASTGQSGYSGHITAVIPETDAAPAARDPATGEILRPAQSQAGAVNQTRGDGGVDWWNRYGMINGVAYPGGKAIWAHA